MGLFDFFKKSKKLTPAVIIEPKIEISDYSNIIEIAAIISNRDKQVIDDFTMLANNYIGFWQKYNEWCTEMWGDISDKHNEILLITAYWLVGYDTDYKYGAYIDWKEATEDILWNLEPAVEKLKYPLNLKEIDFTGEEFTYEALNVINHYFLTRGYTLVGLDTESDCYHLFIIPLEKYDKIVRLGKELEYTFLNEYK